MLFQLTMFPSGKSESKSTEVAKVIAIIDRSGLPYKLGPMSTTIEGGWDEVMSVINRARKMLRRQHSRVYISITVDDRKGGKKRLTGKIESIQKKLRKKVSS